MEPIKKMTKVERVAHALIRDPDLMNREIRERFRVSQPVVCEARKRTGIQEPNESFKAVHCPGPVKKFMNYRRS